MKKILCIIFISSLLFSEESGSFIGFGVGGGFNANGYFRNTGVITNKIKGHGVDIEFIAGYKQFFLPNLGLRYYFNLDYTPHIHLKSDRESELIGNVNSNSSLQDTDKQKLIKFIKSNRADIINAGFNLDLLFNFLVSDNIDAGLYAGGQVGANALLGDLATSIHEAYDEIAGTIGNYKIKAYTMDFTASVNFGFRTNFFKNHAIELFGKIPLLKHNIFDYKSTISNDSLSVFFRQPYIAGIRYVYSF